MPLTVAAATLLGALGAGALSGAAGVGSTALNNRANKNQWQATNQLNADLHAQEMDLYERQLGLQQEQFRKSLEYQDRAWERQVKYNKEMFDLENAYNSPLAQKERYLAAGINPYLAMQGQNQSVASMNDVSALGSPSPGSMPSIPHREAVQPFQYQGYGDSIANAIQGMIGFAQARKLNEEADQLGASNKYANQRAYAQLVDAWVTIQNKLDNSKLSDSQRSYYNKMSDSLQQQMDLIEQTWDSRVKEGDINNYYYDSLARKVDSENRILMIQEDLTSELMSSQIGLNNAQIEQASAAAADYLAHVDVNRGNVRVLSKQATLYALEAAGIDPNTPEGRQHYRKVESEIFRNYLMKASSLSNTFEFIHGNYKKSKNWRDSRY